MAIRAHELAFGDFGQDGALAEPSPHEQTDLADLRSAGQMVPCHRGRRKHLPAISARLAFQRDVPRPNLLMSPLLLRQPDRSRSLMVFGGRTLACTVCTMPAGHACWNGGNR